MARYIISGKISDDTASIWVSLYDEIANKIIGLVFNFNILKKKKNYLFKEKAQMKSKF